MAGHSKWAKVKHFKGAIDAKRAKIFSKLGREITIAAKMGGGDPDMNPRLRMVLLKCRMASMPRDNIERAIKKGTGGGEVANFEDLTYEIYGPHGVALLVEISTDNRNRTASEIRSIVTKTGGSIATSGSVSRLFQRKGQIIVSKEAMGEDALMELALPFTGATINNWKMLKRRASCASSSPSMSARALRPAAPARRRCRRTARARWRRASRRGSCRRRR